MTVADIEKIREKAKQNMASGTKDTDFRVVVGMATCGIAAGARKVMDALIAEINTRDIKNIKVAMTGCIGVCRYEPIIEIYDDKKRRTTYANMTAEKARRVVTEHIVNGRPCMDMTIGAYEK